MSATYPSLSGRHVFITGGATGIGAELVRAFSRQGADVRFIDLDAASGQRLATETGATFEQVDVTDVPALKASLGRSNRIDVLVNNVANDSRHDPLEINEDYWRQCMAVNLDATFFAAQTAIAAMKQHGGGVIINFGSINALLAPGGMPGYVTAKAGMLGLTKALARQYGADHIRVNTIMPGWVVTERQLDKWLTPQAEAEWSKLVSLPDRILPSDVASLALFLAADDSKMITGQQFIIDAGRV